METLQTSRYLEALPHPDGHAVFHRLFGRLGHVDGTVLDMLTSLRQPMTLSDVIERHANGRPEALRGLIKRMIERSYIVEPEIDEYDVVRRDMRFRELCLETGYLVRALQLILSNRCNFGCTFCFFKQHGSAARREIEASPGNQQMSFEVARSSIEKVLEVQRRHGHPVVQVEFFGGEPLMNWPVIEQVLETVDASGKGGLPRIQYSITTNGRALTKEMAELFRKHQVTVTISYNFPTGDHAPTRTDDPKFSRVQQSLDYLKAAGNTVTFNTVLSTDALRHFDGKSYIDNARNYGVQMIGLILDLNLDFYKTPTNSERAMEAIMATYTYGKQVGVPIVGYWHEPYSQMVGKQALNLSSGFKACPGEGCKLSVEPEGHVFVCKGCTEPIGHMNDLPGVFASNKYREYAFRAYRGAPGCEGCLIENFCSSGCMGSLERHYGSLATTDKPSCEVFRELTRRLVYDTPLEGFGENRFTFPSDG
jgi:uncharacterized protein